MIAKSKNGMWLLSNGMTSGFKVNQFSCKCGCGNDETEQELIDKLNQFRKLIKLDFAITCGVRCEKHNKEAGGAKKSAHLTICRAVDIQNIKIDIDDMMTQAVKCDFGGYGLYMGKVGYYMHLDTVKNRIYKFWHVNTKKEYAYLSNANETLNEFKEVYGL